MSESAGQMRELLSDAAGYWERRRITFNLMLAAVVLAWVVMTWPHFREALTPRSAALLLLLALIANACYSIVYVLEIPLQRSSFASTWRRFRRTIWLVLTAVAIILTNNWIADDIYPYVGQ